MKLKMTIACVALLLIGIGIYSLVRSRDRQEAGQFNAAAAAGTAAKSLGITTTTYPQCGHAAPSDWKRTESLQVKEFATEIESSAFDDLLNSFKAVSKDYGSGSVWCYVGGTQKQRSAFESVYDDAHQVAEDSIAVGYPTPNPTPAQQAIEVSNTKRLTADEATFSADLTTFGQAVGK